MGTGIRARMASFCRLVARSSLLGIGVISVILVGAGCAVEPDAPFNPSEPGGLDAAFVSLRETPERLAAYRTPGEGEDTAVLDAALERVFGTTRPPANEATALGILAYVPQVTRNAAPNARTGTACLTTGASFCTGMALAMTALCRRAGLPARVNSLHNFEWMQGHNTVEVYYGDSWHLFDPTYGVFFYSQPDYDGTGSIPALRELMVYASVRQHAFIMADAIWTGDYVPPAGPRPLTETFLHGQIDQPLSAFYEHVFTTAFPVVTSDDDLVVFPIRIQVDSDGAASVGMVDGKTDDVYGPRVGGHYPRYYGMPHIGKTRGAGIAHGLYLEGVTPGVYRITYHFLPGQPAGELGVVELQSAVVGRMGTEGDTWWLECAVQEAHAALLVAARDGQAYVDAITVSPVGDSHATFTR